MADWYVSSAAYATYTAFQGSHLYSIGNIIVPTAPTAGNKFVFRCTTGGTSTTEPSWSSNNNATSTSGTAVFTNITGQSAFFWTAAAGDLGTPLGVNGFTNRFQAGDRVFVSSDHSESVALSPYKIGAGNAPIASFSSGQILSVNRAGSTPPVAADLLAGASVTSSGALQFDTAFPVYHYGITYATTATTVQTIFFNQTNYKANYFDSCTLYLNANSATPRLTTNNPARVILNNTTLKFGNASQGVNPFTYNFQLDWQNTATPIAGTTPTVLFPISNTGQGAILMTCRGVDLSTITGTLVQNASGSTVGNTGSKFLFDSCKIASAVTRYSITNCLNTNDLVELVNCYDGTNIINESYQPSGTLTTETTITLTGGAADDVGAYSHKIITNTNIDKFVNPFCSFWMDVEQAGTGNPQTATVEIISSTALNNDEIALYLQYEGTSGSSVASFGSSFPLTPLTSAAPVTTSTAGWNSSPSTPQKQKCQVSFTPRQAGRLRGQIRVGKASCTVYINPQITVS